MEPKSAATASRVAIELETLPGIGYDLVHNGRPFITHLSVRSLGAATEADVTVRVELTEGDSVVAGPWEREFPLVTAAGLGIDPDLPLDPAFMRNVEEQRPVTLRVTVTSGDVVLGSVQRALTLFAHNQWMLVPGNETLTMGLLAAHVQPNDPVIATVLSNAREILRRQTGSASTQGYQSGPERAAEIAAAVYSAIVDIGFDYSNPPASWATPRQKVRTHAQVFADRAATCLDSALLYAAALESAGLKPLIWIPPGHALVGVWLSQSQELREPVLTDPAVTSLALNLVDTRRILLVETTVMAEGAKFQQALDAGKDAVNGSAGPIMAVVDVAGARLAGVTPLPATRVAADGTVEVHAYQAGSITVEKVAARGPASTRASDVPVKVRIWKNALLDLSLRNQLINFRETANSVSLVLPRSSDELHPLDFIEDELHSDSAFTLHPWIVPGDPERVEGLRGAGAVLAGEGQRLIANLLVAKREAVVKVDENRYAPRLRKLRYASRSSVQETGSNNLYLTLGTLVWEQDGKELKSPLILVPITLEGGTKSTPFRMVLDESGASAPNYCLLEKLKVDHGLQLPHLENPMEDAAGVAVKDIFDRIREAIIEAGLSFRIDETAHLAILQFAKFRLWKDLDDHWERFSQNRLVRHLIETRTEYFEDEPPQAAALSLDDLAAHCPVPADATQLAAIRSAVDGQTFVLEGPPGTGKSQTITNLLARAVAEGRRVLFVAEKRAALDVVQSRLEAVGLGPFCLDLHDKGSKPALVRRQLLESLTHEPARDPAGVEAAQGQLRAAVTILSRYRDRLHETNEAGYSLYSAHERILALKADDPGRDGVAVTTDEVANLSAEQWAVLRPRLLDIGQAVDAADVELDGPWTLVGAVDFDTVDRPSLAASLVTMLEALDRSRSKAAGREALALAIRGEDLQVVRQFAAADAPAPHVLDRMAGPDWASQVRQHVDQLVAAAEDSALRGTTPALWLLPLEDVHRQGLAADASGMLGRKARRTAVLELLRPALLPGHPEPAPKQVTGFIAGALSVVQRARSVLASLAAMPGMESAAQVNPLDPEQLAGLRNRTRWNEWLASAATVESPHRAVLRAYAEDPTRPLGEVEAAETFAAAWTALRRTLQIGDDSLSRWQAGRSLPDAIDAAGGEWLADAEGNRFRRLSVWLGAAEALHDLRSAGLASAAEALMRRTVDPLELEQAVTLGVLRASLDERSSSGRLDAFQPEAHERSVERFSRASATLRKRMAEEIPADLIRSRPFSTKSLVGEVGALQRELNKERRGMSIRALLARYGTIITELTPCFLVSPDSAARFLEPGAIPFDLVVFDEASQIRVAEAVGAMGRAKAVVVVGDTRQMPPSTFGGGTGEGEDDVDVDLEEESAADEESILSECVQARVPREWLSWHYRSQDEALIAFSNSKYYDGRLSSFPPPLSAGKAASVRHVLVPDGYFFRSGDRKTLRTNPREAQAVVDDVVARFRIDADASVGVVTFNIQQRDLVVNLLSTCDEPSVVASLEADGENSLFVKNLENVQGDERDVIVFSLAFSKNDKGVLPLNFGPLNRAGGERRLNVAVTRARREVRVFSSFAHSDMRLEATGSTGVRHLHDYLELAVKGADEIAQRLGRTPTPEDRHREAVAAALRTRGWPVRTDVGLSGFRIDIVVGRRNGSPGDLAAILLDGPGWARRPTVGDRDGLPVDVLRGMLRWPVVSRVWLPTWLHDQESVLDRLETEFAEAVALRAAHPVQPMQPALAVVTGPAGAIPATPSPTHNEVRPTGPAAAALSTEPGLMIVEELSDFEKAVLDAHPIEAPAVARTLRPDVDRTSEVRMPFVPWDAPFLDRWLLDDPTHADRMRITATLRTGADREGPVHVDRLVRLVADAMGIRRLTAEKNAALVRLLPPDRMRTEGVMVVWPEGVDPAGYRNYRPSDSYERALRHVPAIEVGNAMVPLVERSMGVEREELLKLAMRVFGAERLTSQVRGAMEAGLANALERGRLRAEDGLIVRGSAE